MLELDVAAQFSRLVGGDALAFFTQHWRQRVLVTRAALPEWRGVYDLERFLLEYHRAGVHDATLLATVDGEQRRLMRRPKTSSEVDEALAGGASAVLQALLLRARARELPEAWRKLLSLHEQLCGYLLPDFPPCPTTGRPVAALDIFCTTGESTTGGHYDTGDVFYFVFEGEKEWTLEWEPDPATAHRLLAEGSGFVQDRAPHHAHQTIVVRPGDCLYVPPFTYHRVRSTGRSLAASFGLPAFTEIGVLTTLLNRLERESACYDPLPTIPRAFPELAAEAARENGARIARMLTRLGERVRTVG
jgi:ribosomal protein L16 Arg81 hydroxylase